MIKPVQELQQRENTKESGLLRLKQKSTSSRKFIDVTKLQLRHENHLR